MNKDDQSDWLIGRVHEFFQIYPLGKAVIEELEALLLDDNSFKPESIQQRGWGSIYADNSGELRNEKDLIIEYAKKNGIDTFYATSKHELDNEKSGNVLLAKIKNFTKHDYLSLQLGGWMFSSRAEELLENKLWLETWRDSILFTIPLRFVVIQLIDGYGHTTIAGEPELIEMIKVRSGELPNPADIDAFLSTHDFFKKLSPEEAREYRSELLAEPSFCEWVDWPSKLDN